MKLKSPIIVLVSSMLLSGTVLAAAGRILDKVEVELADTAALKAETVLFNKIGQSIALSIAQCELTSECGKNIRPSEVEALLNKLDERINFLVVKQEGSEEDYSEILTAYVDQREDFLKYQGKIRELVPAEPVDLGTEDFMTESEQPVTLGGGVPASGMDLSIFNDVGDPLVDDPALEEGDLPADDFNPEQVPQE